MLYRVIGVMSGSSLDGLDMACVEFHFQTGKWTHSVIAATCTPYTDEWTQKLSTSTDLNARDYMVLDAAYGHFIGQKIREFMDENNLQFKVSLVAVHGHTSFHIPGKMTAQLGDGAAIAAETGLPVITDLRALDVALGGQGAPIVPMSEKMLFPGYQYYLNLGGIANITLQQTESFIAFDVCPANKVLNMLALELGSPYDKDGNWASEGVIAPELLSELNALDFYHQSIPKSLANEFGINVVYPMIRRSGITTKDALATYVEHISMQVAAAVEARDLHSVHIGGNVLVTGGGAKNLFLISRIRNHLESMKLELEVPEDTLIDFKEAIAMAFLGVLRWRDEYTVLPSVTGASRPSVGGAIWNGHL